MGERVVGVASNMERLHKAVFVVRDQKDKINTSCLAQQTALRSCSSLHTASELLAHCPAYIRQYRSDLHWCGCWPGMKGWSPPFSYPGLGQQASLTPTLSPVVTSTVQEAQY